MKAERKSKPDARRRPGEIRDAIVRVLSSKPRGASIGEIHGAVRDLIGSAAPSSIRSYLRLNSESLFRRRDRGVYTIRESPAETYGLKAGRRPPSRSFVFGRTKLIEADCFEWLGEQPENSIHAVVTDPPYGLVEYSPQQQEKLHKGKGGDLANSAGVRWRKAFAAAALHGLVSAGYERPCTVLFELGPGVAAGPRPWRKRRRS
jgi:hypothetical protein